MNRDTFIILIVAISHTYAYGLAHPMVYIKYVQYLCILNIPKYSWGEIKENFLPNPKLQYMCSTISLHR